MALDFPANPTIGQVFTSGGISFKWNGYGWDAQGASTVPEAPNDGNPYARGSLSWWQTVIEVPNTARAYVRQYGGWTEILDDFVVDAPDDGKTYGRMNNTWAEVVIPPATVVSDTAPASPGANQMWWDSSTGDLFIWYNDGTSTQWVQVNVAGV
jgi:hypothetical protein